MERLTHKELRIGFDNSNELPSYTIKNQEEFENMKRKTKNILLGMVAVNIAAVAGVATYKAMH